MADAFHEPHQRGQPRSEQSGLRHVLGQRAIVELLTTLAPVGEALMLGHANRHRVDFHLLEHFGFAVGKNDNVPTIGAIVQRVGLEMVDRLGRKQRSGVLFMAGLPAAFALLAVLGGRFGRRDDVAGRRLGRVRGVLLGRGKLLLELVDLVSQRLVFIAQRPVLIDKLRNLPFEAGVALRNFGELFLHLGQSIGRAFAFALLLRFPRLHGVGHYRHLARVARPILAPAASDRRGLIRPGARSPPSTAPASASPGVFGLRTGRPLQSECREL